MNTTHPGSVLVVEDNADVRDIAVQMLQFEGFDVLEAIDAQSGLEQFKQNPDIDLIFTDVIMPGGISGIEMAKEILALKPHTQILIATGYAAKAQALLNSAAKSDNIVVVAKPYNIDKIPKLIAAMIAAAAAD